MLKMMKSWWHQQCDFPGGALTHFLWPWLAAKRNFVVVVRRNAPNYTLWCWMHTESLPNVCMTVFVYAKLRRFWRRHMAILTLLLSALRWVALSSFHTRARFLRFFFLICSQNFCQFTYYSCYCKGVSFVNVCSACCNSVLLWRSI